MAIETTCTSCGRTLRVSDEYSGKQARCPVCSNIYTVPSTASASAQASAGDQDAWFMKTPEGQIYGPVGRQELDRWATEGRVTWDCDVRQGESSAWIAADKMYPNLRPQSGPTPQPVSTAPSPTQSYGAAQSAGPAQSFAPVNPYADVNPTAGTRGGARSRSPRQAPHRGGLILAFGILGWMFCPIFSFLAWFMGSEDLRQMQRGRMDRSGEGMTQAGQIIGMIHGVLILIGVVCFVGFFLLAAIAGMAG